MEGNTQCSVPGCNAKETDFCIFCKNHYCEEHIFNHECHQSGDDSKDINDKEVDSGNNENEDDYEDSKCAQANCEEEGTEYCLNCKKYYCEEHLDNHECERANLSAKNKDSKDADGVNNENGEEYNDTKCDFLCCTMEAPFICPICHQHFCEKHAFNHECDQPEIPTSKSEKFNNTASKTTINTSKTSTNTSTNMTPEIDNQENTEEYIDNKCDYLGCTGEAPFFCSICQQRYCAKHAFRHECKQ